MKSYIFALAAICLWSTLAVFGTSLHEIPPFLLIAIALLIGSLCGLPWVRQWRVTPRALVTGVYGLFGYHFFLFMAFRQAPAVEANLINYLWPLLIVLLTPIFLKNSALKARHLIASALGFSGAILIVSGGKLSIAREYSFGYGCAAIAALIWSTYSLMSKRPPGFKTGSIGIFCLVSGLLSLACHFLFEPAYALSGKEILPLAWLGLGPMGAAFFLWDHALKSGDSRVIGALAYLTPMLSTVFLVASGHGTLTLTSEIAMALIISGAVVGSWPRA